MLEQLNKIVQVGLNMLEKQDKTIEKIDETKSHLGEKIDRVSEKIGNVSGKSTAPLRPEVLHGQQIRQDREGD